MKKTYFLLLFILLNIFIGSLFLGHYKISILEFFQVIKYSLFAIETNNVDKYQLLENIIFDIRLPRTLAAMLIGASYSVAGASF